MKSITNLLITLFILCVPLPALALVTVSSFSPPDNSTGASYNGNFVITFNTNVCMGGGYFYIHHASDNSIYASIDLAANSGGSISGWNSNTITINPDLPLESYTDYYIKFPSTLMYNCSDMMMMDNYGISSATTWNFTSGLTPCGTVFQDPCKDPLDDATDVLPWTDLKLTFSQDVLNMANNNIYLKLSSNGSTVETFQYSAPGEVNNTTIVTFNPSNSLALNTGYYVVVDAGTFAKQANNGVMYTGTNSTTWNFSTVTGSCPLGPSNGCFLCIFSCELNSGIKDAAFTPLDDATGVSMTSNLTMLFNAELLHIDNSAAHIQIKKTADDSIIETIAMNSPKITISNGNYMGDASLDTSITVNPAVILDGNTSYYIDISCDALKNTNNKSFGLNTTSTIFSVQGKTIWNFTTTAGSDTTPPTTSSISPADNAASIAINSNLVMNFAEGVTVQSGNINIYAGNGSLFASIAVGSGNVTGSGTSTITINPSSNFVNSESYYVLVDATAFDDLAGNSYAGISSNTTWNFTTEADSTPPSVLSFTPADSASSIAINSNLVLSFVEGVSVQSGNINIYAGNGSLFASIAVGSGNVTGSGTSTITINPSSNFVNSESYYVLVDATAFDDLAGNSYAGISSNSTWNFTTTSSSNTFMWGGL